MRLQILVSVLFEARGLYKPSTSRRGVNAIAIPPKADKKNRSQSGECRFNRLGGIHGGKKNAPESSGAITFSGTFSGTLVGARSGAGAGVGAGV
jgi:hypothetical protein